MNPWICNFKTDSRINMSNKNDDNKNEGKKIRSSINDELPSSMAPNISARKINCIETNFSKKKNERRRHLKALNSNIYNKCLRRKVLSLF